MVTNVKGFSLIELMIVILIVGILAVLSAPFTSGWMHSSDVGSGIATLKRAYGKAKAVALRNPDKVMEGLPAAGLKYTAGMLLACTGSPSAVGCAAGGTDMVWSGSIPENVQITINGVAMTTLGIDNSGQTLDGAGDLSAAMYTVTRGSKSANGELR